MSGLVVGTILKYSQARGNARLVLIVIGDCARDDGTGAWPAIKTIAERAGISERTAQRAIRETAELGELIIDENAGPKGAHLYSVCMDRLRGDNLAPVKLAGVTNQAEGGDKSRNQGVTPVTPDPSFLSKEPSKEPSEEGEPLTPDDLVEAWNEDCGPQGLAKVAMLSPSRRQKANLRIREHPDPLFWSRVVGNVCRSPFLLGRQNGNGDHKHWKANFDWLIDNDTNCVKVFEGRYAKES